MGSLGKLGCVICWLVAFRYAWVLVKNGPTASPSGEQPAGRSHHHQPSLRQNTSKLPVSLRHRESPGSVLPSCCLRNVPSAIPQLKSPICRHFLYSENGKHLLFVPHRPLGH